MHPGRRSVKQCPKGDDFHNCKLQCKYNSYDDSQLRIFSWELKCLDCGWRNTIAIRSDDEDFDKVANPPDVCPFCELEDAANGKNLCVKTELKAGPSN